MKKTIAILISSIFLVSCYTSKKAINQSVKAYVHYPKEVAELHSKWYPVNTKTIIEKEYIKGNDTLIYDTIKVDCDSVIDKEDKVVNVPVIKHHYRVDTFKFNQIDTIENTAKIEALTSNLEQYKQENILLKDKVDRLNNRYIFLISWFVLSLIAIVIILIRKIKKVFYV